MPLLNRMLAVLLCLTLGCFATPLRAQEVCEPGWVAIPGFDPNGRVHSMVVYDDGTGPALYVGGLFNSINGLPTTGVAKWDGSIWSPVGLGIGGWVNTLSVLPDANGIGSSLIAGGWFSAAGGAPASNIARWDGNAWSTLGLGLNSEVLSSAVDHDNNFGPTLYVGGYFSTAGGQPANRIAKWDGSQWSKLEDGLSHPTDIGVVDSISVFDDGTDKSIIAAGYFAASGAMSVNSIARWNGTAWDTLQCGLTSVSGTARPTALITYDDGSGPALYVGGNFSFADNQPTNGIARWSNGSWETFDLPASASLVSSFAAYNDGNGDALYAAMSGNSGLVLQWNGLAWTTTHQNINRVLAMAVYNDGHGPSLYFGGLFNGSGQVNSRGIIKWQGCPTTPPVCVGDIADDFGLTAAEGGGPDGIVDFGDFAALLGLIGPCDPGTPGCLGDIADDFGLTVDEGGGPDGFVDFGDFAALLGLIGPCP